MGLFKRKLYCLGKIFIANKNVFLLINLGMITVATLIFIYLYTQYVVVHMFNHILMSTVIFGSSKL